MEELTPYFNDYQIFDSSKIKNPEKFLKLYLSSLEEQDLETLKKMTLNKESANDILKFGNLLIEYFKSDNPKEFLLNFEKNCEKALLNKPLFQNEENIIQFLNLIKKSADKQEFPRQKIFRKEMIVDEFGVDSKTFNNWLTFFGKENFIGRREFDSLEYASIVKDFIKVGKLDLEDLREYHYQAYNRIKIAEIIGDLSKSKKTNYRNLLLRKDEIDDYSPANKPFLDWLQNHRVLPFSLAYRYIDLILNSDEKKSVKIMEVFEAYFEKL